MRLHLSQRGVSTTLGVPGLSMNVGRHGARPNVGLPGTGLAYRFEPFELGPDSPLPDGPAFWTTLARWLGALVLGMWALARLLVVGVWRGARYAAPHLLRLALAGHQRLRSAAHWMSSKKS
jgi:hypothetical protein